MGFIKDGTIELLNLDGEQILVMKLEDPIKPGEKIGKIIVKPVDEDVCKGSCCDATCHGGTQVEKDDDKNDDDKKERE